MSNYALGIVGAEDSSRMSIRQIDKADLIAICDIFRSSSEFATDEGVNNYYDTIADMVSACFDLVICTWGVTHCEIGVG